MIAYALFWGLLFGVLAWVLAFAAMKWPRRRAALVSGSFLSCCISVVVEFFEIDRRADLGDWAGIEATIGAVIAAYLS